MIGAKVGCHKEAREKGRLSRRDKGRQRVKRREKRGSKGIEDEGKGCREGGKRVRRGCSDKEE